MTARQQDQQSNQPTANEPIGLILAGGQSSRMGKQNKLLRPLNDTTLLAETVKRLQGFIETIIISTNSSADAVQHALSAIEPIRDYPLINDELGGYQGPLAGIHSGMVWSLKNAPETTHLISIAADTPYFPKNLKSAFLDELNKQSPDTIIMAKSGQYVHPVFALWPIELHHSLETALQAGVRKIRQFTDQHNLQILTFPQTSINGEEIDPFFNINTPEDWQKFLQLEELFNTARE